MIMKYVPLFDLIFVGQTVLFFALPVRQRDLNWLNLYTCVFTAGNTLGVWCLIYSVGHVGLIQRLLGSRLLSTVGRNASLLVYLFHTPVVKRFNNNTPRLQEGCIFLMVVVWLLSLGLGRVHAYLSRRFKRFVTGKIKKAREHYITADPWVLALL
eukprot:Blabericola_migrator_1__9143@NODE_4893_length_942_cov_173_459429_g647_i3_p1_GENE_NODE_4893_length_942_cov_173_459429_g647_i3NODE_4893_length_942_cov_173_459429_g647_i3_p1_ORF_typecomplete_len155_score18_74DUF3935/PF13071_6/2_1e03DUF3935/PF13071_6/1_1e04DUF3935/PF13071_6/0_23_NODE_4893_length_942_cov_173_459429_g647_i3190654